jgi:transposase InsO family protein
MSENLFNRNFTATSLAQAWVSDITYVRTQSGWLLLTVVLDLVDPPQGSTNHYRQLPSR